jgi:hypothetical protein
VLENSCVAVIERSTALGAVANAEGDCMTKLKENESLTDRFFVRLVERLELTLEREEIKINSSDRDHTHHKS